MKDKLTPKMVAALAAAAILVVALIGWFGFVSPQHSRAAKLDSEIADAQTQLVVAKANAHPRAGAKASGASALVLSRAMPQQVAMSGVVRQLQRVANRSGVRLDSITPQAPTIQSGYEAVPMSVIVTGRYFPIQAFLRDLRTQAGVSGSRVHASGRLFSVNSVSLAAGEAGVPQLAATIQLNVFTYSGSTVPGAAPSTATASNSSSGAAVAAGGTP